MRIHYDPTTKAVLGTTDDFSTVPGAEYIVVAAGSPLATKLASGEVPTVASDLSITTAKPDAFGRDDEVGLLKQQLIAAKTQAEQQTIMLKILILREGITPL